jgi:type I restriction enzyme S subunit
LEKADRIRRTRRHALELSDAFLPSSFLEIFGDPRQNPNNWPYDHLHRLCVKFSDGPFGSNLKTEHYRPSGIRVIRLQNIGKGDFLDEDKAFISEVHFASLRKYECKPGDVLIGTLGDPNLRACIQPSSISVALNKADCVQARPNPDKSTPEFICWLINCPSTLQLSPGMVHGQTRERVSMGQLAKLPVPVPPVQLQQEFSRLAEGYERMRSVQREALRQAEHLFQTLLHQAFSPN